jgi:hypothetical protein
MHRLVVKVDVAEARSTDDRAIGNQPDRVRRTLRRSRDPTLAHLVRVGGHPGNAAAEAAGVHLLVADRRVERFDVLGNELVEADDVADE